MQEPTQATLGADMLALNPHLTSNWTINKAAQDLLPLKYREIRHHGIPLPKISETGFRAFSRNDEDCILPLVQGSSGEYRFGQWQQFVRDSICSCIVGAHESE